jgi:hypothetical protein
LGFAFLLIVPFFDFRFVAKFFYGQM